MIVDSGAAEDYILIVDQEETKKPIEADVDAVHDDKEEIDIVVTMGCGDSCPILPGKTYLDWQLDDPANQQLEKVREIRDQIEQKVRLLLKEML